jgi:predicted metalloprotease with PDZ domain
MVQRISRLVIAAIVVAAAVRADEPRCTSAARDCDHQIRQMLSGRRFLGMTVEERNPGGLTIKSVVAASPAAKAGLRPGDRLIAVNGKSLVQSTSREFKQILAESRETGRVWMIIWRAGAYSKVETRLEPYSKEQIDKIVSAHLSQSHPSTAGAQ